MDPTDFDKHLSHITTLWSLVRQAHRGTGSAAGPARARLLERYAGAVHRYLLAALRDRDAADDLLQEFCLRVLRGDFKNADPRRGRFRNFLKTAAYHLVVDYQRRRRAVPLEAAGVEPGVEPPSLLESDRQFLASWREETLGRAWLALRDFEEATRQPYHTVLRFRTDHPLLGSADVAARVGALLGKAYSVDAIRQVLHRAREKFAEMLLQVVAESLDNPSREDLEQELIEVELYTYCQKALNQRFGDGACSDG